MSFQLSLIGRLFLLQSFYRKKTSNIYWTNKAFFTGTVQLKILFQLCLKIVKAYQRFALFLYSTLEKIITEILQFSASLKKKKKKKHVRKFSCAFDGYVLFYQPGNVFLVVSQLFSFCFLIQLEVLSYIMLVSSLNTSIHLDYYFHYA